MHGNANGKHPRDAPLRTAEGSWNGVTRDHLLCLGVGSSVGTESLHVEDEFRQQYKCES